MKIKKMMLDQINRDKGVNLLQQIGLGTHLEKGKQTLLFVAKFLSYLSK
jgi:hypothetical protein